MATDVSICSNALLRLGAAPINSFDEADPNGSNIQRARLCSNLWPTVRQQVLRAHPWNCATTRVLLSPDTTAPAFGFAYRFLRPSDWLRTLQIGIDENCTPRYRTEGRYLLCDETALPMVYVFDNAVPGTYDATLIGAMELAMTVALAYPVTKSIEVEANKQRELAQAMQMARTIDGQDDPAETLGDFPLLMSRRGGFGRGMGRNG